MLKVIVWLAMLTVGMFGSTLNKYVNELNNLTADQYAVLQYTLNKSKENKLDTLLAAIAWKESNLGKWKINLSDGQHGSYGIYHILLDFYIKQQNVKDTDWNRSRQAEILLEDEDKATEYVLHLLEHWSKVHKTGKTHASVIKSYNAGSNIKSKKAESYYTDINIRMQAIEIHLKNKTKKEKSIAEK